MQLKLKLDVYVWRPAHLMHRKSLYRHVATCTCMHFLYALRCARRPFTTARLTHNSIGGMPPGHRSSAWITPAVYPFIVAVGAIAAFGLYSVSRHVLEDPDIGKHTDLNKLSESAADTYRESPLRKAVSRHDKT